MLVNSTDQTFVAQQQVDIFDLTQTTNARQSVVLISRLSDQHTVLTISLSYCTFDNQQFFGYTDTHTAIDVDFVIFGVGLRYNPQQTLLRVDVGFNNFKLDVVTKGTIVTRVHQERSNSRVSDYTILFSAAIQLFQCSNVGVDTQSGDDVIDLVNHNGTDVIQSVFGIKSRDFFQQFELAVNSSGVQEVLTRQNRGAIIVDVNHLLTVVVVQVCKVTMGGTECVMRHFTSYQYVHLLDQLSQYVSVGIITLHRVLNRDRVTTTNAVVLDGVCKYNGGTVTALVYVVVVHFQNNTVNGSFGNLSGDQSLDISRHTGGTRNQFLAVLHYISNGDRRYSRGQSTGRTLVGSGVFKLYEYLQTCIGQGLEQLGRCTGAGLQVSDINTVDNEGDLTLLIRSQTGTRTHGGGGHGRSVQGSKTLTIFGLDLQQEAVQTDGTRFDFIVLFKTRSTRSLAQTHQVVSFTDCQIVGLVSFTTQQIVGFISFIPRSPVSFSNESCTVRVTRIGRINRNQFQVVARRELLVSQNRSNRTQVFERLVNVTRGVISTNTSYVDRQRQNFVTVTDGYSFEQFFSGIPLTVTTSVQLQGSSFVTVDLTSFHRSRERFHTTDFDHFCQLGGAISKLLIIERFDCGGNSVLLVKTNTGVDGRFNSIQRFVTSDTSPNIIRLVLSSLHVRHDILQVSAFVTSTLYGKLDSHKEKFPFKKTCRYRKQIYLFAQQE